MDNHTIKDWKRLILTTPDDTFFDLMRNYLGDIKTPFNKHLLIEKLSVLLRKKETLQQIIAMIDRADAELISIIYILNEPAIDRLFTVLKQDSNLFELHHHLLNLEERLIIFRESETGKIRINPLLKQPLMEKVIDSAYVFPVFPEKKVPDSKAHLPWISDTCLVAFLSYILKNPLMLKANGTLRKKNIIDIKRIFPGLVVRNSIDSRFSLLLGIMKQMGMIKIEEDGVRPSIEKWISYSKLTLEERRSYIWACAWQYRNKEDALSLGKTAEITAALYRIFPVNAAVETNAIRRMVLVVSEHTHSADSVDNLINVLVDLNILLTADDLCYTLNPNIPNQKDVPLVFQPNFELSIHPGAEIKDAILVGIAADIQNHDVVSRYEITKTSFCRALGFGMSAQQIVERFEMLCGRSIHQNAVFTFLNWEKEFTSLRLINGLILTVDEDRQHLVEHSNHLKPLIDEILAPGIYVLRPAAYSHIAFALKESGIDPVPEVFSAGAQRPLVDESEDLFEKIRIDETIAPIAIADHPGEIPAAGDIRKDLREYIKSMRLPPEQKEYLNAKITKKLILSPNQMTKIRFSKEGNAAKGFDYLGKVRLIQQALSNQWDLLELLVRKSDGSPQKLIVKPLELYNKGSDLELSCRVLPGEDKFTIQVKKIGFLRKLKSALYAP